jgi:TPR repeat protein
MIMAKRLAVALLVLTALACGAAARAGLLEDARAAFEAGRVTDAVALLTKAADGGDAEAAEHLGNLYRSGRGVAKDDSLAVDWYQKAARNEKGDPHARADAFTALGGAYHWGRGVAKDEVKARESYLAAAALGNAYAQNNAAYMLERGLGGPRDADGAARWYKAAADQGLRAAAGNLGLIYQGGRGMRRDEAAASEWTRKAAAAGDARAQFRLGRACERGRGETKDLVEAYKWYLLASAAGEHRAARAAERLKTALTAAQLADAQARAAAGAPK